MAGEQRDQPPWLPRRPWWRNALDAAIQAFIDANAYESQTVETLVEGILYTVRQIRETKPEDEQAEELGNIVAAWRQVKSTKRAALVASKADGNYGRLGLPVEDNIAEALVADRIAALDDRRHLMWKSGAIGTAIGAVIAGGFGLLIWWLQQGGTGAAGN
jgi:hypothetical protein